PWGEQRRLPPQQAQGQGGVTVDLENRSSSLSSLREMENLYRWLRPPNSATGAVVTAAPRDTIGSGGSGGSLAVGSVPLGSSLAAEAASCLVPSPAWPPLTPGERHSGVAPSLGVHLPPGGMGGTIGVELYHRHQQGQRPGPPPPPLPPPPQQQQQQPRVGLKREAEVVIPEEGGGRPLTRMRKDLPSSHGMAQVVAASPAPSATTLGHLDFLGPLTPNHHTMSSAAPVSTSAASSPSPPAAALKPFISA
ncbi:unnamed protein product, partial [Discosporangium mesarthrocarpum]